MDPILYVIIPLGILTLCGVFFVFKPHGVEIYTEEDQCS